MSPTLPRPLCRRPPLSARRAQPGVAQRALQRPLFWCVAALGLGLCLPAQAIDFPPRKPGLWEVRITDGKSGEKPQITQQCVDAASDQAMMKMGQAMAEKGCSRNDMRKDGDRIITESVCTFGKAKITSQSVMTFQSDTAMRTEIKGRYEPPIMGLSEVNSVQEARWMGPCKAGQQPGDLVMPDGQVVNILKRGAQGGGTGQSRPAR